MRNYLNCVLRLLMEPNYRIRILWALGWYQRMEDRPYLEKVFQASMGYPLNLDDPRTFNEKLQWLKLHD